MNASPELSETKLGLIQAAERLFATQGIAATTIRQINEAAGQKNSSAIHYHFGSRDAILDAIVALRVTPVNVERARMIEDARARAGEQPLSTECVVRLLAEPALARLLGTEGPHFVERFLLQLRMDIDAWRRYERAHLAWTLDDLHHELRRARPFIPPQVIRNRFRSAVNFSMVSMAEIEASESRLGEKFNRDEARFRIADLIAMSVALIDAPVSPESVVALRKAAGSRSADFAGLSNRIIDGN